MLCYLLVEKLDILLVLLPYTFYVNMASMIVSVHMIQIGENAIHRIFVEWVFFMKSIFSCLNLKPDDESLPNRMPEVFN